MKDTYDVQIKKIKEDLEKAKGLRYRAEARLEQLNREKTEILRQIEELGVNPDELEVEIKKIKEEVETTIEEIKGLIPYDIIRNIKDI